MGGIVTAFIAPLLFPSDESNEVGFVRDRRVLTGDSFKI